MFSASTGCDIVSSFATRGKKLAWQTWNAFDDVTATFCTLGGVPRDIDDEAMAMFERFTVLLYDHLVLLLAIFPLPLRIPGFLTITKLLYWASSIDTYKDNFS